MKKILIAGGAGFIGYYLTEKLSNNGYEVIVFDNLTNPSADYQKKPFPIINGDVSDPDGDLTDLIKNLRPDFVINLAAYHYIPACTKDPEKTKLVNVVGTINILDAIRRFSPSTRFILASSAAVYAPSLEPLNENSLVAPIDIYGRTKKEAEDKTRAYGKTYGTKYTIFRFFNVYGFGDATPHLIPAIIEQISNGIITLGNKNTKRDYIYLDDIINGLIIAIENPENSENETFNLGTGVAYSAEEIIETLIKINPSMEKIKVITEEGRVRSNDRPSLVADISKIARQLKWVPKVNLEIGLGFLLFKNNDSEIS